MTVVVVFLLYDFYVGLFLLSHCNPSYVLQAPTEMFNDSELMMVMGRCRGAVAVLDRRLFKRLRMTL